MASIQEKYPKCVTCVIRDDEDRILVLEHMKCKNKFTLPAGTMEPDEREMENGYIKTVIREMKEELDIDIDQDNVTLVETTWAYYDRIDGHKVYWEHVCDISEFSGEIKNMEPHKHPSMKWVTPEEVFDHPELYTYQTWLAITNYYNNMWYTNY